MPPLFIFAMLLLYLRPLALFQFAAEASLARY